MIISEPQLPATINKRKLISDAVFCMLALISFSLLITFPFPQRIAGFLPLIVLAFIIARHRESLLAIYGFTAENIFSSEKIAFNVIGILMGVAGAFYYKGTLGIPLLPSHIEQFAIIAVCIGVLEELLFRGFIQGLLKNIHAGFAIFFAALAHVCYKVFIFLSPAAQSHPHIVLFSLYSFGVFIILGNTRHYSKSIIPAILAHAVFDLLVYAENTHAPWWVW